MTDLTYPFDWEAHAAQQIAKQEEEALANAARLENDSRGATGCARMAETAGIPTIRYIR